jgi:hypothetical protein
MVNTLLQPSYEDALCFGRVRIIGQCFPGVKKKMPMPSSRRLGRGVAQDGGRPVR